MSILVQIERYLTFPIPQSQDDRELEETKCRARADTPNFFRYHHHCHRQTLSNQILNEYLKRSSSNPARPHRTHRLQQQVKGWKVKVETMEVVKVIKSKSDKRKSGKSESDKSKSDKSKSGKSESEKVQS